MKLEDIETANQANSETRADSYQNHHVYEEIEYKMLNIRLSDPIAGMYAEFNKYNLFDNLNTC